MKTIVYIFILLISTIVFSQDINPQDLKQLDVESLTDAEVESYWANAQKKGYSLDDLDALATLQGVSPSVIGNLRSRLNTIQSSKAAIEPVNLERSETPLGEGDLLKGNNNAANSTTKSNNKIFGYDFFSNSNISFEPNLSLATPKNYQVGPKDELIISIWGAAENNYTVKVNPDGSIRIPNVGPVFISGMPIELASKKITSALKRIYGGISLNESSPYKVFVDVSLSNVRRVKIDIIGEVKAPATYSLSALSTVINALYAAGGPNVNGTFRNVLHTRNGKVIGNLDIYEYLLTGRLEGNNTLEDQDVIIVRPFKKRVEIKGQVKRQGKYEMTDDETFENLLEYAGGFTSRAHKEIISIQRIEDGQLAIKDITLKDQRVSLKDGDEISVSGVINVFKNRISIGGAVNKPGNYELETGMSLSDLIIKAFGITDDAFLDRGILYRISNDGVTRITKPFSVRKVLDGEKDILLENNDRITIFRKGDLSDLQSISISGAVNNATRVPYADSLSIKDVITIAGGFKRGADPRVIDVMRVLVDDDYETESERLSTSLNSSFEVSPEDDSFYLMPYDKVSVRYLKGYDGFKSVRVQGEVKHPGGYSIENKNDRVSDLIQSAGGLSPYAYPEGATLQRNLRKNKLEQQSATIKNLTLADSIVNRDPAVSRVSIGLDLVKILNNGEGSKYDLILQDDDVLTIPTKKETVQTKGQVLAPSIVRYDKSLSLKDYINYSGGFTTTAKRGKAYVVYSNGKVKATKKFLFFRKYPKLEPGAVILVPQKLDQSERLTLQETIGLTTGLGTLAIIIDRISR